MSGEVLLDTNIVIALFSQDKKIIEELGKTETVFVPSIVMGELYYGAFNSAKAEQNIKQLDAFRDANAVLRCDALTAKRYGNIKHQLKQKGNPIPENDIWIAALAMQYELTLVSRDKHFDGIESLSLLRW